MTATPAPGRTVAVYGGSFNPPGRHHRDIAREAARQFDSVVVVPCGPRPDKPSNDQIDPVHRAAMNDVTFQGLPGVEVDLFDLEQATFTRTHVLEGRYADRGEVWHVVGTDLIEGGRDRNSLIHRAWQHGPELWGRLNFAVVKRRGYDVSPADLPPRHRLVNVDADGSSFALREKLYRGQDIPELLVPRAWQYIQRYKLYGGGVPPRATRLEPREPRLLIEPDERNPKAVAWAQEFQKFAADPAAADPAADANAVLVIGGDGSMLHAIQKHWRRRLPFFGVNAGHLGFLLNNAEEVLGGKFPPPEIIVRHMPMLYVEVQNMAGDWTSGLTFNDAWLERSTGQTAWCEVKVNGQARLPKLVCDGVLLSTAAGSTAYARSMGATPLLADTPAWLMVGSNVMQPVNWKSALLSYDAHVEISCLNPEKRPVHAFMYGVPLGQVRAMRARVSRIAAAELAFCADHDMAEKIARIQFPQCRCGEI